MFRATRKLHSTRLKTSVNRANIQPGKRSITSSNEQLSINASNDRFNEPINELANIFGNVSSKLPIKSAISRSAEQINVGQHGELMTNHAFESSNNQQDAIQLNDENDHEYSVDQTSDQSNHTTSEESPIQRVGHLTLADFDSLIYGGTAGHVASDQLTSHTAIDESISSSQVTDQPISQYDEQPVVDQQSSDDIHVKTEAPSIDESSTQSTFDPFDVIYEPPVAPYQDLKRSINQSNSHSGKQHSFSVDQAMNEANEEISFFFGTDMPNEVMQSSPSQPMYQSNSQSNNQSTYQSVDPSVINEAMQDMEDELESLFGSPHDAQSVHGNADVTGSINQSFEDKSVSQSFEDVSINESFEDKSVNQSFEDKSISQSFKDQSITQSFESEYVSQSVEDESVDQLIEEPIEQLDTSIVSDLATLSPAKPVGPSGEPSVSEHTGQQVIRLVNQTVDQPINQPISQQVDESNNRPDTFTVNQSNCQSINTAVDELLSDVLRDFKPRNPKQTQKLVSRTNKVSDQSTKQPDISSAMLPISQTVTESTQVKTSTSELSPEVNTSVQSNKQSTKQSINQTTNQPVSQLSNIKNFQEMVAYLQRSKLTENPSSFDLSIDQSVSDDTKSPDQSVNDLSIDRSMSHHSMPQVSAQSNNQPSDQLLGQSDNQPIDQSLNHLLDPPIDQPVDLSTNQSLEQQVKQPVKSHSITHLVDDLEDVIHTDVSPVSAPVKKQPIQIATQSTNQVTTNLSTTTNLKPSAISHQPLETKRVPLKDVRVVKNTTRPAKIAAAPVTADSSEINMLKMFQLEEKNKKLQVMLLDQSSSHRRYGNSSMHSHPFYYTPYGGGHAVPGLPMPHHYPHSYYGPSSYGQPGFGQPSYAHPYHMQSVQGAPVVYTLQLNPNTSVAHVFDQLDERKIVSHSINVMSGVMHLSFHRDQHFNENMEAIEKLQEDLNQSINQPINQSSEHEDHSEFSFLHEQDEDSQHAELVAKLTKGTTKC